MYVAEGIPEEFALLRQELGRVSDSRFARGLVHPLEAVLSLAVLGLICGQCSLSAIYRFGDTLPESLAGLGLRRSPSAAALLQMVKVAEVRQAMLNFIVASTPTEINPLMLSLSSENVSANCPGRMSVSELG